jgi:hypothetical protein
MIPKWMTLFPTRIRNTAQLLAYEQDTSSFDRFEVAAARIYLKDRMTEEVPAKPQVPSTAT